MKKLNKRNYLSEGSSFGSVTEMQGQIKAGIKQYTHIFLPHKLIDDDGTPVFGQQSPNTIILISSAFNN